MEDVDTLFRRYGRVEELAFDDEFWEHMRERGTYEKHRVTLAEILEVHAGRPRYFTNSTGRRAPIIMVGPVFAGRLVCVPIEPTGRTGIWRPVTGFEANAHHKAKYREGAS